MRILVINPDRGVARSIRRMLRNDHVSIETDTNAARLRIVDAEDGLAFAAILCDVDIDSTCGIEILHLTRTLREPPLFIFATSYAQLDAVAGLGDGVLINPFDAGELLNSLARLMLTKRRRQHSRTALPN